MLKKFAAPLATVCLLAGAAVGVTQIGGSSTPQSATGSVHPSGWGATPKGFVAPHIALTSAPTATMWDAVTVGNIPAHPFAVAGYPFGLFVTWGALLRDFPIAHHISVAVEFFERAMCGDFEPGDMSDSQAGLWVKADIAAGFKTPCEYADLSNMPAIEASDRAALGPDWRVHVLLWLAWYRKIPGLVPGYDAVQYDDTCLGRNLDCNTVSLNFLRIAQPPYVAPNPKPLQPLCITHRMSTGQCSAVKAKIASDERAATSSQRALTAANQVLAANACRRPYRRGICVRNGRGAAVFNQRISYFTAAAKKLKAAS